MPKNPRPKKLGGGGAQYSVAIEDQPFKTRGEFISRGKGSLINDRSCIIRPGEIWHPPDKEKKTLLGPFVQKASPPATPRNQEVPSQRPEREETRQSQLDFFLYIAWAIGGLCHRDFGGKATSPGKTGEIQKNNG